MELRPTLAYGLSRIDDEATPLVYDEVLQVSVLDDGTPAIGMSASGTETFTDREPDQPSTSTRAERDPGDVDGAAWFMPLLAKIFTEADRDKGDDEPADPDELYADDLVTGVVAF
jgi:putative ATP-grasp target RiPP